MAVMEACLELVDVGRLHMLAMAELGSLGAGWGGRMDLPGTG
jgi:hypothetical protein